VSPMLSSPKPRRLDTPITVSLDDLVPTNYFYRHAEAKLRSSLASRWR
jgi:hypothetical protein